MCGPSKAMKMAAAQEQSTANLMTKDFQDIFGNNQNILASITGALEPVVKAGPSQYGFSAGEDAALRTQALDTNAAASQQTSNAVRSAMAARGGGNVYLPTGSEAVIEGQLAQTAAQKQADAQLGITERGYETGRQNFFGAEGALAGAPGELEAPITSAGNSALSGQQGAYQAADQINQANNAWVAPVAGAIGAIAGGPIGAQIGSKLGGAIAGTGGSGGGPSSAWTTAES
jgi:hypothetical protein